MKEEEKSLRGKKQRAGVRDKESPRETKGTSRREFIRERVRIKTRRGQRETRKEASEKRDSVRVK